MPKLVYVFCSSGRFKSHGAMRKYIDKRTTRNGVGIPSEFMREVGFSEYEPMCIEAIPSPSRKIMSLRELLDEASYSDQWLSAVDNGITADAAICVFAPNNIESPERCSLTYVGAFEYR